jgi:hypothetical protein
LAPFIGIGCPGFIEEDGSIDRGAQNLPGNWESSKFNLPLVLHDMIPSIDDHETSILLHNDAVVQGLSVRPPRNDGVMILMVVAVFFAGMTLGGLLFAHEKSMRIASNDATAAIFLPNGAPPIMRQ